MNLSAKVDWANSGVRTVELQNSRLAVTILPDKGADIYRVCYRAQNQLNVLFQSPWSERKPTVMPHPGTPEEQWMDGYRGGWQTMFPNAGATCTYKGSTQAFHGEASIAPWSYQINDQDKTSVSVTCKTLLSRTPFELTKTVTLHADEPVLKVKEVITNRGAEAIDYVWGQHIAFGAPFLGECCVLHVPNNEMKVDQGQNGPNCRLVAGETLPWPIATTKSGHAVDFSRVPSDKAKSADMVCLIGVKEGWYVLSNEGLQLNVGVSWDIAVFPYLWLWQEFGGSFGYPFHGRCYVMGVEPCSTPLSGGLSNAVEHGFALRLTAGESRETEIAMALFEGTAPVKSISRAGGVVFA